MVGIPIDRTKRFPYPTLLLINIKRVDYSSTPCGRITYVTMILISNIIKNKLFFYLNHSSTIPDFHITTESNNRTANTGINPAIFLAPLFVTYPSGQ